METGDKVEFECLANGRQTGVLLHPEAEGGCLIAMDNDSAAKPVVFVDTKLVKVIPEVKEATLASPTQ